MSQKPGKFLLLAGLIFLAVTLSALAQDLSKRFTASDYFNFEYVSDPQISPDGKKIIYVRNFADAMSDKFYSNLWIINFDGSGNRPLTSGLYHDGSPCWSPDGTQFIYVSDRDGKPQIYKYWLDLGQSALLTNLLFPPMGICWSPDGKQIAYSSLVLAAPRTIAPPPPLPPGAQTAPPAKIIDRIMYRFDGIGYIPGYLHIFVIPAEGGTPRQLTSGNFNHPDYYSREIAWTPDGKFIILSANRRENSEVEILDNEVYEISLTDGSIKALTNRKGPDSSPVVSPDGKFIAYLGFDDRYQGHQTTQLYVMNRDGSGPRAVTKSLDRDVSRVNWANDGKVLYFCYDEKGTSYIAYTTLDGKIKQLTGGIGDGRVAYGSGGSYSIAPGGNFAFSLTKPDHPSDIAVGTVLNPKARIITGVNDDILAFKKLGGVEEIWYTSSVDGRKIQGWILKPPDFDPTKKYPLILEIHGGPFASYGDYFDIEKELLASSGYVVLYTNPRGSTSYGEEFANLIHHSYPGDDFYDLNCGVDAVIQKGYIDENNLFVTGGSGGGVLTCWMIGRTNRFRAAAPLYPVINWYSWVLTSDVSGVGVKYWFPGFPWDNVEHFEKRSLLSVVKNVKTPTMIITGEQDFRCPMSESEQYYMALKLLGIEAVLVRFPDESHGIMARPSHHLSKMMHIIAWFDQHKSKK